MLSLMLMCENERELQILSMAFDQMGVRTIKSRPSYDNYIKSQQYNPDIIIIEMPRISSDHQHFTALVRKHKKTKNIPIIGFGTALNGSELRGMIQNGMTDYLTRPLKFSVLIKLAEKYLAPFKKSFHSEGDSGVSEASQKEIDVDLILNPETLPMQKIQLVVKHVGSLMAFPFTVAKILKLTESSKSGAGDLAKVTEADPVIATTILKISNTVFFASTARRISSIKDAIVRIGFRETKHISMSMMVMDIFDSANRSLGFSRVEFWKHSLATAIIAEMLAKQVGGINVEEVFLAGLLHDFGIILFDEFYPTIFEKILESATNSGERFITSELDLLKISHNDVVKELFTAWKLPDPVTNSIALHYNIVDEEKPSYSSDEKTALCISLGNLLAKCCDVGASCDKYVPYVPNWAFQQVKMSAGLTKNFVESVDRELDLYRQFLAIENVAPGGSGGVSYKIGLLVTGGQIFAPAEHYLIAQGHIVSRIPSLAVLPEQDGKFDIVLIYADPTLELGAVEILLNVSAASDEEGTEKKPLPVIVLADETTPQWLMPVNYKRLSIMPKSGDLRNFDKNLAIILDEGQNISLPGTH